MKHSHNHWMQQSLLEARRAIEADEVPVGTVIVCNNQIIARAHNLTEHLNDFTAHAEMQAFTAAAAHIGGKYLNECTLYVTLEPCVMCAGAAFWTRIGMIVYGATDTKRGYNLVGPKLLHPKTKIVTGILSKECSALLKEYFSKKRNF